jgi:hypothetical protein
MNLDSLSTAASQAADFVSSLVNSISEAQIWPDQAASGTSGLVISALAGVATAIVVALAAGIYLRTGQRSFRDIIRHGLGVAIALGLLAFAAYDMRNAAHADLAKTSLWSATEFELHWQKATARAKQLATEMDRLPRDLPAPGRG